MGRLMTTRIIVSIVASLFVASIAFSQVRYSRPRSSSTSPTPTPTPSVTPQQRMVPTSGHVRANPSPTPLPTPTARQKMVPASAKIPAKQSPAPAQRTMPAVTQPRATPMPTQNPPKQLPRTRTMPQSPQPRAIPTPPPTQSKATPPPRIVTGPYQSRPTPPPAPIQQKPTSPQRAMQRPVQPQPAATPAPTPAKPTPTPVPPPDVKAYLDRQLASSKDKKFHMTVNGKDLALTPFHVWAQKSAGSNTTSTCIDMRSDDGRIYDIDFVTTGPQVTGIKVHKINGDPLR